MQVNNFYALEQINHNPFFTYYNNVQLLLSNTITPLIQYGLIPTVAGTTVNVSAGLCQGLDVAIGYLNNSAGATVPTIMQQPTTVALSPADGFSGYIAVDLNISPTTDGANTYIFTTTVNLITTPTVVFPAGSLVGEVILCGISRSGSIVALDFSSSAYRTIQQTGLPNTAGNYVQTNGTNQLNGTIYSGTSQVTDPVSSTITTLDAALADILSNPVSSVSNTYTGNNLSTTVNSITSTPIEIDGGTILVTNPVGGSPNATVLNTVLSAINPPAASPTVVGVSRFPATQLESITGSDTTRALDAVALAQNFSVNYFNASGVTTGSEFTLFVGSLSPSQGHNISFQGQYNIQLRMTGGSQTFIYLTIDINSNNSNSYGSFSGNVTNYYVGLGSGINTLQSFLTYFQFNIYQSSLDSGFRTITLYCLQPLPGSNTALNITVQQPTSAPMLYAYNQAQYIGQPFSVLNTAYPSSLGPSILTLSQVQLNIPSPTANDFVLTDANGNIQDSGISLSTDGTFASPNNTTIPSTEAVYTIIPNRLLTGFTVGTNTPIVATDSILNAFEKTQGQINAITSGDVISITGTTNQVLVNGTSGIPENGIITLTLPQSIGIGSNVTFAQVTAALIGNVTGNVSGSSGSCTGNSATASVATQLTVTATSAASTFYLPIIGNDTTGNYAFQVGTGITFNPSTKVLTTTTFAGALSGNATTATLATTTTNLAGTTTNSIPYQNGSSSTGYIAPVNNAVLVTGATGIPSEVTQLPAANISTVEFFQQGYLYGISGNPTEDTTNTGTTTLYFGPVYTGNTITLYNATSSTWVTQTFSEVSISMTQTAGNYDVYVSSASSTSVTLNLVAWSTNTPPARSLQNGRLVENGSPANLLVGVIRTNGTNTFDWEGSRWIINIYNQRQLQLSAMDTSAATYSYTETTANLIRAANANTTDGAGRFSALFDVSINQGIRIVNNSNLASLAGGAGNTYYSGISVDTTTAMSTYCNIYAGNTGASSLSTSYSMIGLVGYHYFQRTEAQSTTGNAIVVNLANATFGQGSLMTGQISG